MERSNSYGYCVYTSPIGLCPGQSPLHPNEHYLPAGLGNFKDDIHLKNFICYHCQERFSKFETVFLQNSTEAFLRKLLGVKGRKSHKQKNIFVEPTLGLPPLTVTGTHPTLQRDLRWQVSANEAFLLHQLVFKKPDDTIETIVLRPGKLSQDLSRFGDDWRSWELIVCIADPEQEPELQQVLGPLLEGMKPTPNDSPGAEIEGEMRAQISLPYVQAISKIAFHFVLARFHFTGFEPEFDDLKRFIYLGTGVPRARIVEEPLLPQLVSHEAWLHRWSHILTAEFDQTTFIARLQFFGGPSLKPFTWRVDLGQNPSRVLTELAQGFHYYYYDQPNASGYVGGIEQLKLGPKMQAMS